MAQTPGLVLAQVHRRAQRQLATELASVIGSLWGSLVVAPGRGTDDFLAEALPVVRDQFETSTGLAQDYYELARDLEHDGERLPDLAEPELVDDAVITGFVAAGFKTLKDQLEAGRSMEQALGAASTRAKGTAVRHSLSGGRRFIIDATGVDRLAVGYQRVTRVGCCSFCAMLASRLTVYSSQSFTESDARFIGEGEVKVHDYCRCSLMPVFSRASPDLDLNKQFEALWRESTRGLSGKKAQNAFRRAYEARYLRGVRDEPTPA